MFVVHFSVWTYLYEFISFLEGHVGKLLVWVCFVLFSVRMMFL